MNFNRVRDEFGRNSPGRNPAQRPGSSEQRRLQQVGVPRNNGSQPGNRPPPFGSLDRSSQRTAAGIVDDGARNQPGKRPPPSQQTGTDGAHNSRGCRFSSFLNSHGVRCECTGNQDDDCCYSCWLSSFSIPGWTLSSILDGDEISRPGSNHPGEASNRGAADSLPNSSSARKATDCGTGRNQLRSVTAGSSLSADSGQSTEPPRSIVECISEASCMIDGAERRNLSYSDRERKQVLDDLADLNEHFGASLCVRRPPCNICPVMLVLNLIVSFVAVFFLASSSSVKL